MVERVVVQRDRGNNPLNYNPLPLSPEDGKWRDRYAHLPRQSLILCASLVQNPANLGGLCRTAEAFRLESLVVADSAIAQTTSFRKISASTHQWQPLEACPPERLTDWIQHQRQRGYCVMALQAAPSAVSLFHVAFPRQSVLLLGQELTGIPAPLAALCDQQVMIPQFGLVESLNVHTAGAIASYEYTRQHVPTPPFDPAE